MRDEQRRIEEERRKIQRETYDKYRYEHLAAIFKPLERPVEVTTL